jgi:hypothetical protein
LSKNNPPVPRVCWRINEWAGAVGCCRAHVYDLLKRGKIEARKLGYMRVIVTPPRAYIDRNDTTPL